MALDKLEELKWIAVVIFENLLEELFSKFTFVVCIV